MWHSGPIVKSNEFFILVTLLHIVCTETDGAERGLTPI